MDWMQQRQQGQQEARRALAECLAREAEAEASLATAERAIWQARDAAVTESDDDEAVEMFAAWLPQGRKQVAAAQAMVDRAHAETIRARAVLAHADGTVAVGARLGT